MKVLYVIFLFVLEKGILADTVKKTTQCNSADVNCLNGLIKQFMKSAIDGISDQNVETLDPLKISNMDFDTMQENIFHFANVNINGMKNMEINDVIWNVTEGTVKIEMKLDLIISANMAIEFTDINKSINNITYKAKSKSMKMNTKFEFKVEPNADGVNYFTVASETTNCKLDEDPSVNLQIDLDAVSQILEEDPELLEKINDFNNKALRAWKKQIICQISHAAVAKLIDNFRSACRILPAAEYIRDI